MLSIFKSLTTSEVGPMGLTEQLKNDIITPTKKWFSLLDNVLDGSYSVLKDPVDNAEERGWWSKQSADFQGRFATPITITGTFTPQPLFAFTITGDSKTQNYPTEIVAEYLDADNKVLKAERIFNSDLELKKIVNLPEAAGIRITLVEISKPNTEARLLEFKVWVEENYLSEVMDNPNRQIHCRVLLRYLNPFATYDITPESKDTMNFTYLNQLADKITEPTRKWFSLTDNKLDGTYYALPDTEVPDEQIGWWSKQTSNAQCIFEEPPEITVTMTAQPVLGLTLVGDSKVNNFPVDFDVELMKQGTLVFKDEIRDNKRLSFAKRYVYKDIDKVVFRFLKLNKPNDYLHLVEAKTNFEETYQDSSLYAVNVVEENTYSTMGLPIGEVYASSVDVEIADADHEFDITRPDSPYKGLLLKNREIEVEFGCELFPGYMKWYPYGTFYSTRWNVRPSDLSARVRGLDALELLRQETYYFSELWSNISIYDGFKKILDSYTMIPLKYSIDPELKNIILPYLWFGKVSYRQALSDLAKITTCMIYVDRHNVIQIHPKRVPKESRYTMRNSTTIFGRSYPSAWNDNINSIEVVGNTYTPADITSILGTDTKIKIAGGETRTLTIEASEIPVKQIQKDTVTIPSGIKVIKYQATGWGLYLEVQNTTSAEITMDLSAAKGTVLRSSNKFSIQVQDKEDILANGNHEYTLVNEYMQDSAYAKQLAIELIEVMKNAELDIELDTRGHIDLHLEDHIKIEDTTSKYEADYFVTKLDTYWNGGFSCKIQGKVI